MTLIWKGDEFTADLTDAEARMLLAAAVTLQTAHMEDLNKSNPKPYSTPSKPGEFPRKRTGFLQSNVAISPGTVSEIRRSKSVRVGYKENASYGLHLANRGRLWVMDSYERVEAKIKKILETTGFRAQEGGGS